MKTEAHRYRRAGYQFFSYPMSASRGWDEEEWYRGSSSFRLLLETKAFLFDFLKEEGREDAA